MRATATDQGIVPKSATMDLEIMVVESHKKAPTFISVQPEGTIYLPENLTDFSYNIATIIAAYVRLLTLEGEGLRPIALSLSNCT